MSNKYTASKQGRTHGGYRRRLNASGEAAAPRMSDPILSDGKRANVKR